MIARIVFVMIFAVAFGALSTAVLSAEAQETKSDSMPSNVLGSSTDPGNNATYQNSSGFTIGSPYYHTEVGAHENSATI